MKKYDGKNADERALFRHWREPQTAIPASVAGQH